MDGIRPRFMDIRPKWMKEKVIHEDKADEFGEDTGVQECIDDARTLTVPAGLFSSNPVPNRPSHNVLLSVIVFPQPRTHSRPPQPQSTLRTASS